MIDTVQCEALVLAELRERNEDAFADFVVRHGATMRRVARAITRDLQVAEEAVQETWLAVLKGLDRFQARSTLRTWVFRILVNRARSIAMREARTVPFSALETAEDESGLPPGRTSHAMAAGHWTEPASAWNRSPEQHLLTDEVRDAVRRAVAALPRLQREVITLRDIEGWDAGEVCRVLGLTEGNQRVLLHRARAGLRRLLANVSEARQPW